MVLWACPAGDGAQAYGGGRCRKTSAGLDGRPGSGRGPGLGWGPGGARSARLARRPPGTGKGAGAKMFLIPASSCLARLHHSLLINRFLLPSSPTAARSPLAGAAGPRPSPAQLPDPRGSCPLRAPSSGIAALPRPEPPTSASPRGRALDSGRGGRVGSGPELWEPELQPEAPSEAGVGLGWGRPLPLRASEA